MRKPRAQSIEVAALAESHHRSKERKWKLVIVNIEHVFVDRLRSTADYSPSPLHVVVTAAIGDNKRIGALHHDAAPRPGVIETL